MTSYAKTEYLFQDTFDLSMAGFSVAFLVEKHSHGSLQFTWQGLDAADATFNIEGSNDNENWQLLYNPDQPMADPSDSVLVEFTHFTTRYIRLRYTANSVTTGSGKLFLILKR